MFSPFITARLALGSAWLPPYLPGALWIHALSVGETLSALSLVKGIKERFPKIPIAFSVATIQGLEVAQKIIAKYPDIVLFIRPLDIIPRTTARILNRLQPILFCLIEGDIWPNCQLALARRGVPQLLINSRISPKTFYYYRSFSPLARKLFQGFNKILVQSQKDLDYLIAIGVEAQRLQVNGNIKFDNVPSYLHKKQRQFIADRLGLRDRKIFIAGSTHPGEEEFCLKVFLNLRRVDPTLIFILAPRDIKRSQALVKLITLNGLKAVCFSQGISYFSSIKFDILVIDVLDILSQIYALGIAAFVGGSLVNIGGHNLLEPAAQGIPIFFGPYIYNFIEIARGIIKIGGGCCITNSSQLTEAWKELIINSVKASIMSKAALIFCKNHRGATQRCLKEIEYLLRIKINK